MAIYIIVLEGTIQYDNNNLFSLGGGGAIEHVWTPSQGLNIEVSIFVVSLEAEPRKLHQMIMSPCAGAYRLELVSRVVANMLISRTKILKIKINWEAFCRCCEISWRLFWPLRVFQSPTFDRAPEVRCKSNVEHDERWGIYIYCLQTSTGIHLSKSSTSWSMTLGWSYIQYT